jgi:ribosomal subunit interface protein
MQVPLHVTLRNIAHSDALEARIRTKAEKLEGLKNRLLSISVTVESRHRHQRQGREYAVSLDIRLPGREVVVNREHDEDVYVALRDAFDAARRQLEELAEIRRGEVKGHRTA